MTALLQRVNAALADCEQLAMRVKRARWRPLRCVR
jgi:hypothetical protein